MKKKPDIPDPLLDEAGQWLFEEASNDPQLRQPIILHKHRPPILLKHKGDVVGFHIPAKAKQSGLPATGTIFVAKKHRRKGVARKTLASFLKKHPDAVSFIHDSNTASQKTHAKAGWAYSGRAMSPKQQVWKKADMKKTANQIAVNVLEKCALNPGTAAKSYSKAREALLKNLGKTGFKFPQMQHESKKALIRLADRAPKARAAYKASLQSKAASLDAGGALGYGALKAYRGLQEEVD